MSNNPSLPSSRVAIPPHVVLDRQQMSHPAPQTYTNVAILVHWVMALLVLLNLSLGFSLETIADGGPQRNRVLFYHASVGIVIFLLMVFRLGWRLAHQPPALPQSVSKQQQAAAHTLHWVLYFLMLVQPERTQLIL